MAKADLPSSKRENRKTASWVVTISVITFFVSGLISLLSEELLSRTDIVKAFLILFSIVFVGIIFDVIGVAVTSADERPFHSMAARKVPGAAEAIRLLRNAERVGSICNDVVGDICGVISGSASAVIASKVIRHFVFNWPNIVTLLLSAVVAAVTVGGKALGKAYAINSCTEIVHTVGKIIRAKNRMFCREKKKK